MGSCWGSIADLGLSRDLVAEVATEVLKGTQVGFVPDDIGELPLQASQTDQPDVEIRLELHKHIHVALTTKSSRSTEPNSESLRIWFLLQNSAIFSWSSLKPFAIGINLYSSCIGIRT